MSLIKCKFSNLLIKLYTIKPLRKVIKLILHKAEGAEFYSYSLREIQKRYYGVTVGKYSYGECMKLGSFPPNVVVGNYTSIARDVRVITHDHPLRFKSTHPFFYNKSMGYVKEENIIHTALFIGHDVWIGDGAKILSKCNSIGSGSVIAAGAIVTRNVEAYEIVAGIPAKNIGYRFEKSKVDQLLKEAWWEKSVNEITSDEEFYSNIKP
ncbi:CatB-related O-acetyltransferase [Pseudoalteromonas neustonica]|uniref:CatB-related O-acetyltransferase n=1 Tax=Pseudoalteromonas neustonica TaxID=1840331 RepID=A0ABU9U0C7_9GAMM